MKKRKQSLNHINHLHDRLYYHKYMNLIDEFVFNEMTYDYFSTFPAVMDLWDSTWLEIARFQE